MKYRDFVGVIVLVGLVVLWMSRSAPVEVAAAPVEVASTPKATAGMTFSPTPDIKAESRLTELGPASSLFVEAASQPDKLEDLTFKITVATKTEFVVPLNDKSLPRLTLIFQWGEKSWNYSPREDEATGSLTVREGRQTWEVALRDFVAPDDLDSLRQAYGKERIRVTAILSEDDGEQSPDEMMTRKISRLTSGMTYLEP